MCSTVTLVAETFIFFFTHLFKDLQVYITNMPEIKIHWAIGYNIWFPLAVMMSILAWIECIKFFISW